jgi:hypothetical protein
MLNWFKSKGDKVTPALLEKADQEPIIENTTSKIVSISPHKQEPKSNSTEEAKSVSPLIQLTTLNATSEDVVAAYKIFLGRLPESADQVQSRLGISCDNLLFQALTSKEFLDKPDNQKIILVIAKRILDLQKMGNTLVDTASIKVNEISP